MATFFSLFKKHRKRASRGWSQVPLSGFKHQDERQWAEMDTQEVPPGYEKEKCGADWERLWSLPHWKYFTTVCNHVPSGMLWDDPAWAGKLGQMTHSFVKSSQQPHGDESTLLKPGNHVKAKPQKVSSVLGSSQSIRYHGHCWELLNLINLAN